MRCRICSSGWVSDDFAFDGPGFFFAFLSPVCFWVLPRFFFPFDDDLPLLHFCFMRIQSIPKIPTHHTHTHTLTRYYTPPHAFSSIPFFSPVIFLVLVLVSHDLHKKARRVPRAHVSPYTRTTHDATLDSRLFTLQSPKCIINCNPIRRNTLADHALSVFFFSLLLPSALSGLLVPLWMRQLKFHLLPLEYGCVNSPLASFAPPANVSASSAPIRKFIGTGPGPDPLDP